MARHPELKIKWTSSLQQCRAEGLNPTIIAEYFQLLAEVLDKYKVPAENIYNMDEKGIQLGVSKRVAAIIDRDQKMAFQVKNGNRELVTIIETLCTDGMALRPCVIFQGKRRNLEWGRDNPCNARYVIVFCWTLSLMYHILQHLRLPERVDGSGTSLYLAPA